MLDFMTLLHLLLEGKIADVRKTPGGRGLDAIRLQTDDVARALGAPILSEMMNRAEVAKRLRTSRDGLHAVEAAGHLVFRDVRLGASTQPRPLCERTTVEAFDAEFISSSRLASDWKISLPSIYKLLADRKVAPALVNDNGYVGCFGVAQRSLMRVRTFKRGQLMKALREASSH